MAKNTVRTIEERKALCTAKYELMGNMPSARKAMPFEEWIEDRFHWWLTLEQYNDENTPKYLKDEADKCFGEYIMETEAYNDLLDDMYALLS